MSAAYAPLDSSGDGVGRVSRQEEIAELQRLVQALEQDVADEQGSVPEGQAAAKEPPLPVFYQREPSGMSSLSGVVVAQAGSVQGREEAGAADEKLLLPAARDEETGRTHQMHEDFTEKWRKRKAASLRLYSRSLAHTAVP